MAGKKKIMNAKDNKNVFYLKFNVDYEPLVSTS